MIGNATASVFRHLQRTVSQPNATGSLRPRALTFVIVVWVVFCFSTHLSGQEVVSRETETSKETNSIRGDTLGKWAAMLKNGDVSRDQAKAALPKLMEFLNSESERTREDARSCLIAMGADAADAVPVLVKMLREDRRVRGEMATLRQIGSPAVEQLMAALDDPNSLLRQRSCEVLSRIRPVNKETAEKISRLLSDSDHDVRKAASQSLRYVPVKSKQILTALLEAIDNPEFTRRRDLIAALRHQGASAMPTLLELLTSKDDGDRHQAVMSLTELGRIAESAVPALKTLLAESEAYEQGLIVNCLQAIGPAAKSAIPQLIQLLEESDGTGPLTVTLASAIANLDSDGKQAIAILINRLELKLENSKRYLKPNQGRGSPGALGYVAPLWRQDDKGAYTDDNDQRHINALAGLVNFGQRALVALPHIRRIIQSDDELSTARAMAIGVWTKIAPNDPATITMLEEYANHPDSWIAKAAQDGLRAIQHNHGKSNE